MRKSLVMTLQLHPSEFPNIWGKFCLLFFFLVSGTHTLTAEIIYSKFGSFANESGCKVIHEKGFLLYEETHTYLVIYEEAVSHIWLCNCSHGFSYMYEEKFLFFFINARTRGIYEVRWLYVGNFHLDFHLCSYFWKLKTNIEARGVKKTCFSDVVTTNLPWNQIIWQTRFLSCPPPPHILQEVFARFF